MLGRTSEIGVVLPEETRRPEYRPVIILCRLRISKKLFNTLGERSVVGVYKEK